MPNTNVTEPSIAQSLPRTAAVNDAAGLMAGFAERTGLVSERPELRYLWTELLLARIFICHLGLVSQRLFVRRGLAVDRLSLSPVSAFVLSRLEDGVTIRETLDTLGAKRLDVLACLVQLVSAGAVTREPVARPAAS